jgi:SNF2 family DNA or RNA helicase
VTFHDWTNADAELRRRVADAELVPGVKARPSDDGRFLTLEVPENALYATTVQALDENVAETARWLASKPCPLWRDWKPKQPLYEHQEFGAMFIVENGGALLADDMGLGKTRTAIAAVERLSPERPNARTGKKAPKLIIGPLFTRAVWIRELLSTGAATSEEDIAFFEGHDIANKPDNWMTASWWFIHYDIAAKWKPFFQMNARGVPSMAIIDEAHWVRNGRTARAKGTQMAAGTARRRLLLTGTPISNEPAELWFLLTLLDGPWTWGTPADFRKRYCGAYHDGYGLKDGFPTNTEELSARLTGRYLRRTAEDIGMSMPELTREPYRVRLGADDYAAMWKECDDAMASSGASPSELYAALMGVRKGNEVFKLLHELRQITSRAKVKSTVQVIQNLQEQGEAAVVFVWEKAMANKLAKAVGGHALHGDVHQDERDAIVRRFQEPTAKASILIATYGVLKEGVSLDRGRHVVLHDLPYVPGDLLQAEARVRRITQKRPCISTWMLVDQSFDDLVAKMLFEKADHIQQTLQIGEAKASLESLGLDGNVAGEALAEAFFSGWEEQS